MLFAGLDLGGYKDKEKTCLCFIEEKKVKTFIGIDDKEIISLILSKKEIILSIDSPLSFPKKNSLRYSEKKLKEILNKYHLGYLKKFILPPLLPSMKVLTKRAIKIKRCLSKLRILETHPTISIFFFYMKIKFQLRIF